MPLRPGEVWSILKATAIGHDEKQLAESQGLPTAGRPFILSAGTVTLGRNFKTPVRLNVRHPKLD